MASALVQGAERKVGSFLRDAAVLRTCRCHCSSPILPTIVGLCLLIKNKIN